MKSLTQYINERLGIHGSAWDFDEFKLDQGGKATGDLAYGWGLYFADNEYLAKNYMCHAFDVRNDKRCDLLSIIKSKIKELLGNKEMKNNNAIGHNNGYIYYVELPDEEEKYIDWFEKDKNKLSEIINKLKLDESQQEKINKIMNKSKCYLGLIYEGLYNKQKSNGPEISKLFEDAGYVGFKVKPFSRVKNKTGKDFSNNWNYVIFNPKNVKIIKKDKFEFTDNGKIKE